MQSARGTLAPDARSHFYAVELAATTVFQSSSMASIRKNKQGATYAGIDGPIVHPLVHSFARRNCDSHRVVPGHGRVFAGSPIR
jgi:orotidine-5'-phosphate decarboxylase